MISKVGAVVPGLALTAGEVKGVTAAVSIAAMLAMFRAAAVLEQHNADRAVVKLHRSYDAKREDDLARLGQLMHARQMTEDQMRTFLMNRGVYPGSDPFSAPYVAEAARRNAEK